MNFKKWFLSKKLWLQGGIIGVIICIALFLFYVFLYFPIIRFFFEDPEWAIFLPFITGHAFPLLSHFIIEGSSLVSLFCEATESTCVSATIESGCVEQIMTPTTACIDYVESISFSLLSLLLIVVYFLIGAIIGKIKTK